ncbi:MAG TPA: hypothetical protein DEA08_30775 [Planctomycetes bacterium]|nr:hypothetical protein [Planctomycetota bacterium]
MTTAIQAQGGNIAHSRARELDCELRSCVRRQIAIDAKIAVLLAELQEGKLWRELNCTSLTDYGRRVLGYSSTKTSDLLQIGRRKDLPQLIEALEEGSFGYKAAAEIARVATSEDVEEWIQKGKDLRLTELRAEARGEDLKERVVLELLQEQFRVFDSGIEFVRKGGGPWDVAAIVALVFADFMERHANSGQGDEDEGDAEARAPRNDRFRVHVDLCAECGKGSQETSRGAVPLGETELERLCCDVEVLDLRGGAGRVTRTIPTRVRNWVWGRDRGKCQVPGCGLRGGIDIHHLDPWWKGHDRERMLVLCGEHHDQVHEGLLHIEGRGGAWGFLAGDGVPLGGRVAR